MEFFVAYILSAAVGALLAYVVVRLAVTHSLKAAELWKADGGLDKAVADQKFARTGIRENPAEK